MRHLVCVPAMVKHRDARCCQGVLWARRGPRRRGQPRETPCSSVAPPDLPGRSAIPARPGFPSGPLPLTSLPILHRPRHLQARPVTACDFRYSPPKTELPPELGWVFLRAFGPLGEPVDERVDPGPALELARKFEVSTRIAARQGSSRLVAELGKNGARELVLGLLKAVARERALGRTVEHIAALAAEHDVEVVFLKFAALWLRGDLLEGSRGATDIDVLVSKARMQEFQEVLRANGFEDLGFPGGEHQLPILKSPDGGGVEVHHCVKGLQGRKPGTFATIEDLLDSGQVVPAQSLTTPLAATLGSGTYVPTRDCLLAHAVVHAFVQHGAAPHAYPLSRMFADLIDLGLSDTQPGELGRVLPWLGEAMSATEIDAVDSLSRAFARGDSLSKLANESSAGMLLCHLAASTLDVQYRKALRLRSAFRPLTAKGPTQQIRARLWNAFVPTRAQLAVIYGPPRSEAHLLARRLYRPVDLALRLGRYSLSYASLKLRRKHRSSRR